MSSEKITIKDIASATVAYNDEKLIGGMLDGLKEIHNLVIISKPWRGEHTSFDRTGEIAERMGAEVIYQDFDCQQKQRNFMMEYLEEKGYRYVLIVDTDEYYLESDIQKIIDFINENPADAYSTAKNDKVFWKSWKFYFIHGGATNCLRSNNRFTEKRAVKGKRSRIDVSMYHFSFNRSKKEMIRKIQTTNDLSIANRYVKEEKIKYINEKTKRYQNYVETSHVLCKGFLDQIIKELPNVILIYLYRDIKKVAKSLYKHKSITKQMIYDEKARSYYRFPTDKISEFKIPDNEIKSLSEFELCLWYWYETHSIYKKFNKIHKNIIPVKLENINTVEEVESLFNKLDIKEYDKNKLIEIVGVPRNVGKDDSYLDISEDEIDRHITNMKNLYKKYYDNIR